MPIQVSVRKLMAIVAVLGVVLAAFRAHFSLGSFAFGVLSIAWIKATRRIEQRRAAGLVTRTGRLIATGLTSVLDALLLMIVCQIVPVLLFESILESRDRIAPEIWAMIIGLAGNLAWGTARLLEPRREEGPGRD